MLYPGQRHGIVGEAPRQHLWQTLLDFFRRELMPS
jgi:alpha-beta hydrolase superfamily lysophospholipase